MATKKIADISKYQGIVDWSKAAEELYFCILRASCGTSKDTRYEFNASECKKYGIPFHAYHYMKAISFVGAFNEAEAFCAATKGTNPLFYVVDCEYSKITVAERREPGFAKAIVENFIFRLKQLVGNDVRVAVYIGHHLYKCWGLDYATFAYVWIPRYGKNKGLPEIKPAYECDIWQFTSMGSLAGVKGRVDLNQMLGNKPLSFFTGREEEKPEKQEEDNTVSYDPKKVIEIASAEVGYLEKKSNSNLDDKTANAGSLNFTKYGRDLDAINFYNGRKNGVAWCDVFVDWCFVQAFGKAAALKLTYQPTKAASNCGAGCKFSRGYYQKNKRLFDEPQPGDQIFFYPKDGIGGSTIQHTGLVYAVDKSYVYTIEGNTSGANGVVANGGGVCKKKYKLTYARLAGFGRPVWGTDALDTQTPAEEAAFPEETVAPVAWLKTLTVNCQDGEKVNARKGNGTVFASIDHLTNGTKMEWVATSANGWHAGVRGDQVVWVSDKYSIVT